MTKESKLEYKSQEVSRLALDLGSLQQAIRSLESAIGVFDHKLADSQTTPAEMNVIRAGVIQNFEFTYELCWK